MPVKPDGKLCVIREQIIDEPSTGLTIQFEVMPDGETRLRLFGASLPLANREYCFNAHGEKNGAGTATRGLCRPAWTAKVEDL